MSRQACLRMKVRRAGPQAFRPASASACSVRDSGRRVFNGDMNLDGVSGQEDSLRAANRPYPTKTTRVGLLLTQERAPWYALARAVMGAAWLGQVRVVKGGTSAPGCCGCRTGRAWTRPRNARTLGILISALKAFFRPHEYPRRPPIGARSAVFPPIFLLHTFFEFCHICI